MFDPSDFRAAEVQFDKEGKVVDSDDAVLKLASEHNVTDLVLLSHGWNNDMADAARLYAKLAASLRAVIGQHPIPAGREIALAALYWPSKKFAEEDLIPGGAAAATSMISEADVVRAIDDLRDVFTSASQQAALDEAARVVPQLEDKATARKQFASSLLSVLDPAAAESEDATTELFRIAPGTLMDRLAVPAIIAPPQPAGSGGALGLGGVAEPSTGTGAAAGLGSTLGGILGAAKNLLNGVTYYEMKARAGTVGEKGLAPLVKRIRSRRDANDTFGGIGRNGAQKTPEALQRALLDVGGSYTWQARSLHNLLADQFVKGHSDVTNKQVAHALLSAVAST